ncbi:MAG TPA: class I SAM-dependent methyltransferase [Candidatus Nanoarchaeia archaeon]|nr:class I SAM-dependent methyltransferase [Candidatus Nanoarchaeia archaeon]
MEENHFWDLAWGSPEKIKDVKLIDLIMHKSAVQFTYQILGEIKNKNLLEIGCGSGMQTIDFIRKGARVTAIDLSEESISLTKEFLKKNNFKALVKKIDAEKMDLPDHAFDVVYINCVLMHADQDKTISECLRVLKPGGIIVFKESLKPWIATFPYRTFSPYMKTKPHYLTLRKVRSLNAKHKEFYLLGSFLAFLFYLLKNKRLALCWFSLFEPIDNFLLKNFPFWRTFAWVAVGVIKKK